MTHGSLFSGIGGFDLAAQWMGWENKFHCEINDFSKKVLNYYWPESESYEDIKKTDFTKWNGLISILTGGFPCQPYSTAGKRLGKEDERHLWPEMLRAIREIQPRWIVGENVRGFTNWNGGLVFDEVQADLEAEGYEVLPFLLPAACVGADHQRDRIWIIAHTKGIGNNKWQKSYSRTKLPIRPNLNGKSFKPHSITRSGYTEPQILLRNDGVPCELDGIAISNWRMQTKKSAGNAIVPQVAYQIFKAIEQYENNLTPFSKEVK